MRGTSGAMGMLQCAGGGGRQPDRPRRAGQESLATRRVLQLRAALHHSGVGPRECVLLLSHISKCLYIVAIYAGVFVIDRGEGSSHGSSVGSRHRGRFDQRPNRPVVRVPCSSRRAPALRAEAAPTRCLRPSPRGTRPHRGNPVAALSSAHALQQQQVLPRTLRAAAAPSASRRCRRRRARCWSWRSPARSS